MVALLFVGHAATAQSFSSQGNAVFNPSTSKNATTLANADLMVASEAVQALKIAADALGNPSSGSTEAEAGVRRAYYYYLADQIVNNNSVENALLGSVSNLNNLYARYKGGAIAVSKQVIFNDALNIVSN